MKLKVLDLFSGIGGFSLGLERTGGFETVAFCEIESFPRKVLAKHWPDVPCHEDVRKLKGEDVGPVDLVCGGYPCQPFSTAGKRGGKEDDRHLWPEFSRLVAELRPAWVIGENVAGHISMGLDDVLSDLEGQGYACRTLVIPACAVGAPHRRDRCWVVAYRKGVRPQGGGNIFGCAEGNCDGARPEFTGSHPHVANPGLGRRGGQGGGQGELARRAEAIGAGEVVADAGQPGLQGRDGEELREYVGECASRTGGASVANATVGRRHDTSSEKPREDQRGWSGPLGGRGGASDWAGWLPEPDVGRVAHGVPQRVDRLKALGNAVVPQIPELIGRAILAAECAI